MSIQYFTSDAKIASRQLSKENWLWNNVLYSWGAKWMSRRSLPWFQNQSYPYVGKSPRRLGFVYCIKCRVLAYLYLFCSYTERKIVSTVRLCSILSLIFWCLTVLGLQSSWLFVGSDRPCIPSDLLSSRRQRYLTRYLHSTQLLLFCQILDGPSTATKPEQKSPKLNVNAFQDRLALLQGLASLEITSSCTKIEQEIPGWLPNKKVNSNTKVVDFTMEVDDNK